MSRVTNQPLHAGAGYQLGEFTCPAGADRWRRTNWIGAQPHVVIPRTAVRITAEGAEPHVSTANDVLIYDRDAQYRRELVSAEGDRCLYLVISDELADELALTPRRAPALRHAPCPARAYLLAQLIRSTLARPNREPLRLDEAVLAVLSVTASAIRAGVSATPKTSHEQRAAVEEVKSLLATAPDRRWTLPALAAQVHYSPFFLARLFRRLTGYSIAGYRQQLRLRLSLEPALRPGTDLSSIAASFGFSSHSHYTRAFHQAFAHTPTELRRATGRAHVLTM